MTNKFAEIFWKQQTSQFWTEEEIPLASDRTPWMALSDDERDVFKKVLGGLTMLDTLQSTDGMPLIQNAFEDLQVAATLNLFSAMESIHAKSYSTIFTTVCTESEIDEIFEWVEHDRYIQFKGRAIRHEYLRLMTYNLDDNSERKSIQLYISLVASVFLESFLFYSGFFFPLYLKGQGKMVASGEIISLIIRDESIII